MRTRKTRAWRSEPPRPAATKDGPRKRAVFCCGAMGGSCAAEGVCRAARGIHAWRGSTVFLRRGSLFGRYPHRSIMIHAMRGCSSFRRHEPGRSSSAGGERRTVWLRRGRWALPRFARYPRMAWIYGGTSRVIGGAVWTWINRRSTPCVDALRSGAMNPGGLLRLGVNVGRFGCAVVARLRWALPRCARYPRMAWIYGVFTSRVIAGAASTHGVDLRFFTSRSLAWIHRGTPRATSHGRRPVRQASPFFRRTRRAISLLIAITAVSAAIDRNCRRVCDSESSRPKISASTPRPITVRYG